MRIAVVGSNMVDLTAYITRMPAPGETLEAPDFALGCGGKGANQAVAAALCGADVMMVSRVGTDIFADNTIRNFKAYGVDTTHVKKVEGMSSGVAPIFVDQHGQNSILIIKGANNALTPAAVDAAEADIRSCGLIILQLEIPLETVYHTIELGRRSGIPVLLNPAPATKELAIDRVCACDFFVPNETELAILTEMPTATQEDVEHAAVFLLGKGLKNVIVTLGERGVLWMTKTEKHYVPACHVDATDTSGAGDAFIGCFSSSYVQDGDTLAAIRKASAFAALSVTRKGTQMSYPDRATFAAFLAQQGGR